MKEKKYLSLPVEFKENKQFSFDDSLIPIDIKVMHDGLNLNNSTFFDEAINLAKDTLKNKPILGYIKKGEGSDDVDFAGHEMEIVSTSDGFKVVYLERPLGTVPESNNYSVQKDDDGRSFVHCRGYLWREYLNDGYEILQSNPNKSVSMEIAVDDYDINEDGSLNILKYRYLGITILGDDVLPGMDGAEMSVVGQFEKKSKTLHSKMESLNKSLESHFSKESIKGGENLKKEDIAIEENIEQIEPEVELEEVVNEEVFEEEIIEDVDNNNLSEANDAVEKAEESEVQLDIDDARETVNALEDGEEKDSLAARLDVVQEKIDSIEDDVEEDESAVGGTNDDYLELLDSYKKLELENAALKEEVVELKEFKSSTLMAKKEEDVNEIFAKYSTLLEKSDMEDLMEGSIDMELDALEKELSFRLVQRKFNFSKTDKKDSAKISIVEDKDVSEPYGSASIYFNK